jgi:hypothetical protein
MHDEREKIAILSDVVTFSPGAHDVHEGLPARAPSAYVGASKEGAP